MGNNSLDIPLVNNLSLRDQWRRANFHTGAIGAPSQQQQSQRQQEGATS